jgi:hypothetical protein
MFLNTKSSKLEFEIAVPVKKLLGWSLFVRSLKAFKSFMAKRKEKRNKNCYDSANKKKAQNETEVNCLMARCTTQKRRE